MTRLGMFPPTRQAALARLDAVRPNDYARSRNAIDGAVTCLSPYITHGLLSLPEVLAGVTARHPLDIQHKFVFELGWREYFRHVWAFRGNEIFESLHEGPLPHASYADTLPCDIRQAATNVPVIDMAVRTLYETGYLHNHARMWLASYVVHVRKVDWRIAADWLYGHLLDGDLASNHLSWQWVAGTGSKKPYLFNAANVARYAPTPWHSPGSVIDQSYEALDRLALEPVCQATNTHHTLAHNALIEPPFYNKPHPDLGFSKPDPSAVAGRDVWLVHPWNLSDLPTFLPANTLVVGVFVNDFHRAWPWNERRWRFVAERMAELAAVHWQGDAAEIGAALQSANRVRSLNDPHLSTWLPGLAVCDAAVELFPTVPRRCDSFSQWWTRTLRGVTSVSDLLTARQAPARWMD